LKHIKSHEIVGINFLIIMASLIFLSPFFFEYKFSDKIIIPLFWVIIFDMSANYFFFSMFKKINSANKSAIISMISTFSFVIGWLFWIKIISYYVTFLIFIIFFVISFLILKNHFFKIFKLLFWANFFYFCSSLPSGIILFDLKLMNAPTLYMVRAGAIGIFATLFSANLQKLTQKEYKMIFLRGLLVIGQWVSMYLALIEISLKKFF